MLSGEQLVPAFNSDDVAGLKDSNPPDTSIITTHLAQDNETRSRLETIPESSPPAIVDDFQEELTSWPPLGVIPDSQPTNSPIRKPDTKKGPRSSL